MMRPALLRPAGPTDMIDKSHRHGIGVARREFLQVGMSGLLGLGLADVLAGRVKGHAAGSPVMGVPRAKSVLLIFLTGGPSHIDTFDMKPDAPEGIRGPFRPIDTKAPGIRISEHLPKLAAHADKLAIVRSMTHGDTNHLNATHWLLTGHRQPFATFDKVASRDDYPCYGSALSYFRPRTDGVPSGVMLPTFLVEGPLTWPGQHAGCLGPKYDPWQIRSDPSRAGFRVEGLTLPYGYSVERLAGRRALAEEIGAARDQWSARASGDPFADQQQAAYQVLLSGAVAKAFRIDKEDPKIRDKYGRHMYGQSLLLARRLVQAGVPIVQVNMGRVQTWDSHGDIANRLGRDLLPPTDTGVAALLDDMAVSGLLDETLVIVTGEFGRTPKIGLSAGAQGVPGRDHWAACFTSVFAGAGVKGGRYVGSSDKNGAYPATSPHTPGDLAATVYAALGIEPEAEMRDRLDRPLRLYNGSPIGELYTG